LEIQPEDLTSDVDSGLGAALSAHNGVENLDQENESRGSLPVPLTEQTGHAEQSGVDLDEHLLQLVIPMQGATMQVQHLQVEQEVSRMPVLNMQEEGQSAEPLSEYYSKQPSDGNGAIA
jgi:hypothetical protein